jgi:hypothetical protein
VIVLEIPKEPTSDIKEFSLGGSEELRDYLNNVDSDSQNNNQTSSARYFFVDDLSVEMICILGAGLDVPLEFFESHFDSRNRLHSHAPRTCSTALASMAGSDEVMYSVPWRRVCYMMTNNEDYLPRNTRRLDHDLGPDVQAHPEEQYYFRRALCERLSLLKRNTGSCETGSFYS